MSIVFGQAPTVVGTEGSDVLIYDAAEGDAWLEGLAGDDLYLVDQLFNAFDIRISELAGGGIDTVEIDEYEDDFLDIDWLSVDDNVLENLTVEFSGGEGDLDGGEGMEVFGNDLDNHIQVFGGGNDQIDGGAGADTMDGGEGDDQYRVDNAGDVVVELEVAGNDAVFASASHTLSANVEELWLLSGEGSPLNINGTGNALDNRIDGNDGNNVLSGLDGGDWATAEGGNDTLLGGNGNDQLEGGAGNDSVSGGADNDSLYGQGDNDTLAGDGGEDWLQGDDGADRLDGGTGNDMLFGGAGLDTLIGGAGNDVLDGGEGDGFSDVLNGGMGNDEYFVGEADVVSEDSTGGGVDTVFAEDDYVLPTNIEDLYFFGGEGFVGTGNAGNNRIRGHLGEDSLVGGAGNDVLDGAEGSDTLVGGAGNDRFVLDSEDDVVVELAGQGTDHVFAGLAVYQLGANLENLTLVGFESGEGVSARGNELNNLIVAGTLFGDDELRGEAGNDTLDGGEGGEDALYGGAGSDTYIVRSADTRVVELSGQGTDTVRTYYDIELGNNVENAILIGDGGEGELVGNDLGNSLTGNDRNNFLWGRGGSDTMIGGDGDDDYVVEDAGDVVTEGANGGDDTVFARTSHTLGANVENLILTGGAAAGNGNGIANWIEGNIYNNTLTGGNGDDTLLGGSGTDALNGGAGNDLLDGGRGNDAMTGGLGNDRYLVNSAGDTVVGENSTLTGGGVDTVEASVTYTLVNGVENLELAGSAANGTGNNGANSITGNALRNVLVGLGGNDVLNGGGSADNLDGGTGNDTLDGGAGGDLDTLTGGTGNDRFVIDRGDEVINEGEAGGSDTVVLNFNGEGYSLEGTELEHVTFGAGFNLFEAYGNGFANALTGNEFSNLFEGREGNDTLVGDAGDDTLVGGAGRDQMTGGAGNDLYDVDLGDGAGTLVGASAEDVVTEAANNGHDVVRLFHTTAVNYTLQNHVEDVVVSDSLGEVAGINITGNTLDNFMLGNNAANRLDGGAGNDSMDGGAGLDTLLGGAGNDTLWGGANDDDMRGGAGDDTYFFTDAGDVANETVAGSGGTDLVVVSFGASGIGNSHTLGSNLENATLMLDGTGGLVFNGNGLGNEIEFDNGGPLTVNAGGGDDSVANTQFLDVLDAVVLDGGGGSDHLTLLLGGALAEFNYSALSASGFESIDIAAIGSIIWVPNETPTAADFSISGLALQLGNVSAQSTFQLEDFGNEVFPGFLALGFAADTGDTASVSVTGANQFSIFVEGVDTLALDIESDGSLINISEAGADVSVSGPGSVALSTADGQTIALESYSGSTLELVAGEAGWDNTLQVDDSDTTVLLQGSGSFDSLTIDTTGSDAGSRIAIAGENGVGLINLVGASEEILRLDLDSPNPLTLDGSAFLGDLILTNEGNGLTYNAGDSVDWLRLNGNVAETLNYGANEGVSELGSEDRIEDWNFGGDADVLSANMDDFGDGELFIEGIETINFHFTVGGTTVIDAAHIVGDFTIFLDGGEGTRNVTLENLQGDLNASALTGSVHAFAADAGQSLSLIGSGGSDELEGGFGADSLRGGLGSDTLAGNASGDSFFFESSLGGGNVDTVLDFSADSGDLLVLDHTIFAATAADGEGGSQLGAAEFLASAGNAGAATSIQQRIIYDTATGALYYDADGSGAGASVQFAQLGGGETGTGIPLIDQTDFLIVS